MGLLTSIDLHALFPYYFWPTWLCMCVLGSLVIIGMGYSRCDNVFEPTITISE